MEEYEELTEMEQKRIDLFNELSNTIDGYDVDTILRVFALMGCLICDQFGIEREQYRLLIDHVQNIEEFEDE